MKTRSREIGSDNGRMALKFDRHLGSSAAKVPVKFQSHCKSLNLNLAAWVFTSYCGKTSVHLVDRGQGVRLTKAYDVTIKLYRNSYAKIKDSNMHILWCMGSTFCVKGSLRNTTKKFEPTHRKMWILRGVKKLTTYDILELWHLKS